MTFSARRTSTTSMPTSSTRAGWRIEPRRARRAYMLLRLAAAGDVAQVASLVRQYWEFESIRGFDRPRIEALLCGLVLEPQRGACWVAEADGRLCGYLLAVFM